MALRDKLRERVQPLLEPGENIEQVFLAQTGPTPWLAGAVGVLIYMFVAKYRVIAVTDRSIVILKAGAWTPTKPTEIVRRVPRATKLGPYEAKVWGKIVLDGERHWVHRRFKSDVDAADAAMPADGPAT